jgi:hypothetical protein
MSFTCGRESLASKRGNCVVQKEQNKTTLECVVTTSSSLSANLQAHKQSYWVDCNSSYLDINHGLGSRELAYGGNYYLSERAIDISVVYHVGVAFQFKFEVSLCYAAKSLAVSSVGTQTIVHSSVDTKEREKRKRQQRTTSTE